jgi:hypothetical protein
MSDEKSADDEYQEPEQETLESTDEALLTRAARR